MNIHIIAFTEASLKRLTDAKEDFLQRSLKHWPSWINADHLTITKILCIFPVIFFIFNKRLGLAFWFFIFGAFLDLLDGGVARHQKKETVVGSILDPLSDKILVGTALLLIFLVKGHSFFSPLIFCLILFFDLILVFLGSKVIISLDGLKRRLKSNLWGKWKFFLQTVGISLLLLQQPFWAQLFLWPSIGLAIASIIGHISFRADSA